MPAEGDEGIWEKKKMAQDVGESGIDERGPPRGKDAANGGVHCRKALNSVERAPSSGGGEYTCQGRRRSLVAIILHASSS